MVSWTVDHSQVWKWLQNNDGMTWVLYWDDFNPSVPSWFLNASECFAYNQTTNFDLAWFQPWHEVLWFVYEVTEAYWYAPQITHTIHMDFLRSSDWSSWETWWYENITDTRDELSSWDFQWKRRYWYAGVDYDEIWEWYTHYKFHVYTNDWAYDLYSPTFTVSNLNIDSTRHPAWFMWVEWSHLCYTDATHYSTWYKHKIAYDWNYNSFVWTDYSWMIWLDTTTTRKIYYVDEYWYKRRTYAARDWYTPSSPWTNKSWAIWTSTWWYSSWWIHLCFVSSAGDKLRILNWPPAWVT